MLNTKHIKLIVSLLFISSLFTNTLSADILNGTHWVIKPGDSLYKIARTIYPNSTKLQAQLRKELVNKNPQVFKNGASNISVGDQLQLPAFAIKKKKPATVVVVKKPEPVIEPVAEIITPDPITQPTTGSEQMVTPDPQDIIGQVIINVGSLSAENRGATRELKRRSSIYRGDTLSTGGRSLTQIRLKDGALLSLRPHTDIRIAEYSYNGQQDGSERSILELLKGGFRTITGAIGHINKQNYQVRTSIATIGIRGTHYSLVFCQQSSCSGEDADDVEDGLYGGVANGRIIIENSTGVHSFSNDQFFKLTSASAEPVEFLLPPAILKHGAAKSTGSKGKKQQTAKQAVSKQIKSAPRRLAVIFEPNQPDFRRRPKVPVGDLIAPPVAEFQPEKAPDGSAMLIGFQQLEDTGVLSGTAASVIIAPNNNNQIFLGPNRTPIAAREASVNDLGVLVQHELILVSPDGTLAKLVPSSVGGNAALGVNWGRWNGDFTVLEDGARLATKDNFHYIYSENLTSPTQLANLGGLGAFVSYSLAGGTLPTDNLGNVAVNAPFVDMSVDFIKQEITSYGISATVNGKGYNASANNIAFQNLGREFTIQSISAGCPQGTCIGEASVLFVGTQAQGALTSYHIEDTVGPTGITGTGLLVAAPQ